jgi:hypothetical protein
MNPETPLTPAAVGLWVLAAGAALPALAAFLALFSTRREVELRALDMGRRLDFLERQTAALAADTRRDREEILRAVDERAAALRSRIETLIEATARLHAETDALRRLQSRKESE